MYGTPRNIEGTSSGDAATFNIKSYLKNSVMDGETPIGPDVLSPSVHLQIDNTDQQSDMYLSFDGGDSWLPVAAGGSWDGEVQVYRFMHKTDGNQVAWKGIATFA